MVEAKVFPNKKIASYFNFRVATLEIETLQNCQNLALT